MQKLQQKIQKVKDTYIGKIWGIIALSGVKLQII